VFALAGLGAKTTCQEWKWGVGIKTFEKQWFRSQTWFLAAKWFLM